MPHTSRSSFFPYTTLFRSRGPERTVPLRERQEVQEVPRGGAVNPADAARCVRRIYSPAPWHFLNFLPLPQGHGSFRPTRSEERRVGKEGRPRGVRHRLQ